MIYVTYFHMAKEACGCMCDTYAYLNTEEIENKQSRSNSFYVSMQYKNILNLIHTGQRLNLCGGYENILYIYFPFDQFCIYLFYGYEC